MRRQSIFILVVTTALLATSPARAQVDLTEIVKKIQPVVTTIITYGEDKEVLGQGTGFFVDKKGHLVTNYHVLKGAHGAEVKTYDEKIYTIKSVVVANEDTDLVKVSVDIPEKAVRFVQIVRTVPEVAERVLVVGSPLGLEQTVTEGIVSAVREIPSVGKILQLSAAISPGSSGSPVVNMKGEVVGVATFQLVRGQSLNFAVCSEQILALKSLPKAKSLAEWTSGFPDLSSPLDTITETPVDEVEIPDNVRMAYSKYKAAKQKIEDIEAILAKALKMYQPTSKTVAEIRERLKRAQADLDKAVEGKRPVYEIMCRLLEEQIMAKQVAYDELTTELLPSAPQAKALEQQINALRQRQMKVMFSLGGKPGETISNSIGMKLVWIPAGEFMMGSPSWEEGRSRDLDEAVHRVKINKGFWMGQTEVTREQYQAGMGTNPRKLKKWDNYPVENLSWNDAMEFCRRLSKKGGQTYTLPTEAQWEYACRAGSKTRFSFGDSDSSLGDYAWYSGNSNFNTHPVGKKKPNAFGLYDMHGNVWEWCSDYYHEDYYSSSASVDPKGPSGGQGRVIRGGSMSSDSQLCRPASRDWLSPGYRTKDVGFRVVFLDFQ